MWILVYLHVFQGGNSCGYLDDKAFPKMVSAPSKVDPIEKGGKNEKNKRKAGICKLWR